MQPRPGGTGPELATLHLRGAALRLSVPPCCGPTSAPRRQLWQQPLRSRPGPARQRACNKRRLRSAPQSGDHGSSPPSKSATAVVGGQPDRSRFASRSPLTDLRARAPQDISQYIAQCGWFGAWDKSCDARFAPAALGAGRRGTTGGQRPWRRGIERERLLSNLAATAKSAMPHRVPRRSGDLLRQPDADGPLLRGRRVYCTNATQIERHAR
jgi:hypothetical protein